MNKIQTAPITAPDKAKMQKKKSGALNLTQKVDYGLILLTTLAKENSSKNNSIKEIATEKKISFHFLQKVARLLSNSKIISAKRGKYGGYKLAISPEKLTLKKIIESIEGPIALVSCLAGNTVCNRKNSCKIKLNFQKINQELQNFFESKTLNELTQ